VTDGDTIEIHGTSIRLSGFDAPEHGRRCGAVNVGQQSALALSDFIGSRTVHCALTGARTHEHYVATCSVGGVDLGEHMVEQGWARDWPRYSRGAYADEEARARAARRGVWGLACPANLWGNRNYTRR
jgi:endonuclease YncB( thermonuclease family)